MADFREVFAKAKHIIIITGAGVSAESGVPTFRGAGGFWRKWQAQVRTVGTCLRSSAAMPVGWVIVKGQEKLGTLEGRSTPQSCPFTPVSAVVPWGLLCAAAAASLSLSAVWEKECSCRQLWVFLQSLFLCCLAA